MEKKQVITWKRHRNRKKLSLIKNDKSGSDDVTGNDKKAISQMKTVMLDVWWLTKISHPAAAASAKRGHAQDHLAAASLLTHISR